MDIGVHIVQNEPTRTLEWVAAAETAGVDMVTHSDSQAMYPDTYPTLALTADRTSDPRVGVMVSNPVTRHVGVTASAMGAIDAISDGRAVLGIGTGDSAVANTELESASLGELDEYVTAFRTLFETGEVDRGGDAVRLRWPTRPAPPVFVAADGPAGMRLAGEVGDGVITTRWLTEAAITDARDQLRTGAGRRGRDPGDIELWMLAPFEVADTTAAAVDHVEHTLAAHAHIATMHDLEEKVPADLVERFRRFGEDYRSDLHHQLDDTHNADLLAEHGLREFMRDNRAVAGTPEEVTDKLRWLEGLGVDGVLLVTKTGATGRTIERLGTDVLPALAD